MRQNQKQELSNLVETHSEKINILNNLLMKKMRLIIANNKNEQLLSLELKISELEKEIAPIKIDKLIK